MNASSRPEGKQNTWAINEPGLIPEARPKTVAACVPPQPAHTPQKFVTLHQIEIVPTGPDPQRDPKFLAMHGRAMHGSSRQRQRRERPRSQPYPTSVQQPQRSSAIGRGIQIRPDASGQQFQPSPASMSQSRSRTSTGVMNESFHTSHGQPRTQPQLIFGPQHQPQQCQVDTNVDLSPYGGHVFQLPDMARLDPSAGWRNGVPTTLGEFAQRQLAQAQFAQGQHTLGEFAQRQLAQGQLAQGQHTLGEFAQRQLAQEQFTLGEFAQRQLAQGQFAHGQFTQAPFTTEQFNQGQFTPTRRSGHPS